MLLWEKGIGSQIALYPNLNVEDPEWRTLMRDVRFRRALSLGINRHEINEVVYFGLAKESSNTVLQRSPLFRPEFRTAWTQVRRQGRQRAARLARAHASATRPGLRLLPDGRPMEIVVDTSGESTEETDVLELVRDSWRKLGIALFSRPSVREVFRKRVYSGKSMMTIWSGLNNGIPTPEMSPNELAPTAQEQLQWPMWGQYYENNRKGGEAPALARGEGARRASTTTWRMSASAGRARADLAADARNPRAAGVHDRHRLAGAAADRGPGTSCATFRPKGIYSWDPGSYFGMYHPDTFWLDPQGPR